MVTLKPSEFPVGSWFVVPLPVGEHFALGVIVDKPNRKQIEVACFGPYDHTPTTADAARLAAADAMEWVPGITSFQIFARPVINGTFPLLPTDGAPSTAGWFEPTRHETYSGAGIAHDLSKRMTPDLWVVTDPVALSSWFCHAPATEWLETISDDGNLGVLTTTFEACEGQSPVPVDASVVALMAIELAARTYTVGHWDQQRIDELPAIDHGVYNEPAFYASRWPAQVDERERRDRRLMKELAAAAERTLDLLLERSAWVAELRDGAPAGWAAFAARVDALRTWLRSEWLQPRALADVLDGMMGALDAELGDELDEPGPRAAARPVAPDADSAARRTEMSWYRRDDVADWTAGQLQADGDHAVRAALDIAIDGGDGDSLTLGIALAAADIVARRAGDDDATPSTPDETDVAVHPAERRALAFVAAGRGDPVDRSDIERARRVIRLARQGELADEIEQFEDESRAAWAALLDELERRLADA